MTTQSLFAQDVTATFHEVAMSKPTAGIGLHVTGKCGHAFLAARVTEQEPSMRLLCCGCRGVMEKETCGVKSAEIQARENATSAAPACAGDATSHTAGE
jgi:hypothetical protein